MKRTFGGLAALLLILGTLTGAHLDVREHDSDKYLGEIFGEDKFYGHSFTHDEYLRSRGWPVKAGICLVCDDGDSTFYTEFVRLSDSIYAADGVRIKGTTFIMASQIGVAANLMSAEQLVDLNTRQDEFEIGCHGPVAERVGPSRAHSCYSYLDSLLSSYQDHAQDLGIKCFRSYGYANWRMQLGMGDIWKKNGIYQCKSIYISVLDSLPDYEYIGSTSWDWPTNLQVNADPWPCASVDIAERRHYQGYHRIGGMVNDYDVGSRSFSSKSASDPGGTPDSLKKYVDLAIQTGRIGIVTLHDFRDIVPLSDSLMMPVDSLAAFMGHISSRIQEGVLESYTFEQACARMRGHPTGNLLPHYGFRLLNNGVASLWAEADTVPIGWPYDLDLYYQAGERWTIGATGQWTAYDLSTSDFVLTAFTVLGKPDSVCYGLSDTSRNIMMTQAASTSVPSQSMPFYIWTTGSEARYVNLTIQAAVFMDTCSTMYCSIRAADFEEVAEDYVNGGAAAYKFMIEQIGGRNAGPDNTSTTRRSRMRLLASYVYRDTTTAAAHWPATAPHYTVAGAIHAVAPQIIRPYILDDKAVNSWSAHTQFANYTNLSAAGAAWNSLPPEWPVYHTQMEWKSWNFKIPITPGRTDCLCGHFVFRPLAGTSLASTNMRILVSAVSAYGIE